MYTKRNGRILVNLEVPGIPMGEPLCSDRIEGKIWDLIPFHLA